MAVLRSIVCTDCSLDEHMLRVCQFRDIEFGATLVNGSPQHMRFTAQHHEHPIEMSGTAHFALSAPDALRETGVKLIEPAAYGSIGVVDGLREVVDHRVVLTV